MATAVLYGFSTGEAEALGPVLERTGWERVAAPAAGGLPPGLEAMVSVLESTSLVLAAVRSAEDAEAVGRCAHLDPDRLFAAAVGGPGAVAVSALALDLRGRLFFLPVREGEAERVLRECRAACREIEARLSVARGMRRHELDLDMATGELRVGEVATYLADRLRDAGFSADAEGRRRTGVALEEALLNAVEHGNLELDSRLRSVDAVGEDAYERLRRARLADPRYASRRVRVRLAVEGDRATLELADEGSGIGGTVPRDAATGTVTGRGMALIRRAFESVEHRGSTLVLRCRKEQGDASGHARGG